MPKQTTRILFLIASRYYLLLIGCGVFFSSVNTANAYCSFDKNLANAYTAIFNLDYTEANALLKKESAEKPGNDLKVLYEGYIDFLKAFMSENAEDFARLKNATSKRLALLSERSDPSSPFYLYAQAELMMQEAMVKIKFREYLSAVTLLVKANNYIEKNKLRFPTFLLNEKPAAIIDMIAGSVPKQYQWLSDMAGITGTVTQGQNRLALLYYSVKGTEFECYRPEILFYQSMAESIFGIDEVKAEERFKEYASFKITPLLAYSLTNMLMKTGKNDSALAVFNRVLNQHDVSFPFLYYKRGLSFLRKGEYDQAEKDFTFFLTNFSGTNYIKSTWQKLSWIKLMKNDRIAYYQYKNKVIESGSNYTDEDKEALHEASAKDSINLFLLSSRLYFDGGYYDESLKALLKCSTSQLANQHDKLEYTYRMGRIMEKTGRVDRAIVCYENVMEAGRKQSYYFAANSALLLGTIYERSKDFSKARTYYQQALTMKDHEYRNSIDQKAKAGLDRCK